MNKLHEVGWQCVKWWGVTLAQTGSLPWHAINLGYGSFNNNLLHRSLQIHFTSSKILLTLINPHNSPVTMLIVAHTETGQWQLFKVQWYCCCQ